MSEIELPWINLSPHLSIYTMYYRCSNPSQAGIHGTSVGPGPIPDFEVFLGPGPVWSEIFKILLVLVRARPRFGNFSWSWSGLIPGLEIILSPGPVWFKMLKILLVLVRVGPGFLQFFRSWSGPVLGPRPNRSVLDQLVLVHGSLISSKSQFKGFPEYQKMSFWSQF